MANNRSDRSNETNKNKQESSSSPWGYLLAAGGAAVVAGVAAFAIGYSEGKEECHQTSSSSSNNSPNKKYSSASKCAICIDKIKPVKVLNCGHSFHEGCVDPWLNQKRDCPICRSQQ